MKTKYPFRQDAPIYIKGDHAQDVYWETIRRFLEDDHEEYPTYADSVTDTNNFHLVTSNGIILDIFDPLGSTWDLRFWSPFNYPRRWNKLLKDYLNPDKSKKLFKLLTTKSANRQRESGMVFLEPEDMYREEGIILGTPRARHTHGPCLFGISFRSWPMPTVTVTTRSTFFNPIGVLDLGLGLAVCEILGKQLGYGKNLRLRWNISQFQLSAYKILPLLANMGLLDNWKDGIGALPPILQTDSQFSRKIRYHIQKEMIDGRVTKRLQLQRPLLQSMEIVEQRCIDQEQIPNLLRFVPAWMTHSHHAVYAENQVYATHQPFFAEIYDEYLPDELHRGKTIPQGVSNGSAEDDADDDE